MAIINLSQIVSLHSWRPFSHPSPMSCIDNKSQNPSSGPPSLRDLPCPHLGSVLCLLGCNHSVWLHFQNSSTPDKLCCRTPAICLDNFLPETIIPYLFVKSVLKCHLLVTPSLNHPTWNQTLLQVLAFLLYFLQSTRQYFLIYYVTDFLSIFSSSTCTLKSEFLPVSLDAVSVVPTAILHLRAQYKHWMNGWSSHTADFSHWCIPLISNTGEFGTILLFLLWSLFVGFYYLSIPLTMFVA
jgi:hypothetical protein